MNKGNTKKRKNKKYYHQFCKKQKKNSLSVGMKGVLITCNRNEKLCVRDAYNIFNEYGDKLYGPELSLVETENNERDAEEQLEAELQSLKKQNIQGRRFQQLNTNVPNCLFIKTEIPDPREFVYSIFKDIQETKTQKTRFILRMLPISHICKANTENIQKTVENLLENFIDSDIADPTFSIIVNSRYNNSINKRQVTSVVYQQITKIKPSWKANLKTFQIGIIIEILQTLCCLGIAKDYQQFRKYNLAEVINTVPTMLTFHSELEEKEDAKNTLTAASPMEENTVIDESKSIEDKNIVQNEVERVENNSCINKKTELIEDILNDEESHTESKF